MSQLNAERKTLDLLAEEFVARYRRGERPALSEYLDAHPELADEIRELFPTLVMMEELAPSDSGSCAPATTAAAEQPPLMLGDYRLLREVGRGGMGVVYEAEQLSLGRRVALKMLHRHTAGDSTVRQRFHREARAAAQLHHTNIVPVFEVGEDQEACWYAMQLILGQGLDQIIEELRQQHHGLSGGRQPPEIDAAQGTDAPRSIKSAQLSQVTQALVSGQFACPDLDASTPTPADASAVLAEHNAIDSLRQSSRSELSVVDSGRGPYYRSVARIGRQAADALAYAHARGIIHRDIKPSNLLLDTAGVVWITDFGLAKTQENSLTITGDIVGTLRYMAPERFKGEGDERADVYGLGLTLYELLVLRPAFAERDRLQLIDHIKHQEPVRPRAVDRRIPRDLETIILKAIDKEAKRRYATAEALAEDLRRFLADEPIRARRTSELERLRLWGRRNPALAALSASLLGLLILVAAGATATAFYLKATLDDSENHRTHAEQAEREGKYELWRSYQSQAQARRMSRQSGQRFASLRAIKAALALPVPPGHSRDELRAEAIAALCLPDLVLDREGASKPVGAGGFTIDSAFQRYAWADREGLVRICRLSDDAELRQLPGGGWIEDYGGLQFSPDGRFLHQICNTPQGLRSRLWDLDAPEPRAVLDDDHNGLAFRPDSREVAVSYRNRTVRFLDLASSRELRRFTLDLTPSDRSLLWNPKLPHLCVYNPTSLRLLNVDTGAAVQGEPKIRGGYSWVGWHPEGRLLAVSSITDRKIYLWDVTAGRLVIPPLEGHNNSGIVMCFNRTGDRLLSTDWSGNCRLWDARSGRLLLNLPESGPYLCFSPDERFVGVGGGGTFRRYHFRRGAELRALVHHDAAGKGGSVLYQDSLGSLPDAEGRLYAIPVSDRGIALMDLARGEEAALLPLLPGVGNKPLRFDAEGALWTGGPAGLLRWPAADDAKSGQRRYGPPQRLLSRLPDANHDSSADMRVVAIPQPYSSNGAVVFHRDSKRLLQLGPQEDVRTCAISPDGRWVATGSHELHQGAGAKVWDAHEGRHVKDLPVGRLCFVCFSPDGKWLLTTSGGPRLWAAGTWQEGPRLGGTSSNPFGAFSRDGKLLALGDEPSVVRLVATDTGAEIARLTAPAQARLQPRCFTPDGTKLVSVGHETNTLYIFDLAAIRVGLAEIDLDWDAPPLPAASVSFPPPLSIHFELGDFRNWTKADALVNKAAQQILGKKESEGLDTLRQAVTIAPSHAEAHNNLAWLLLAGPKELRDPVQALVEARKAVELAPDQFIYLNTLGVALYRTEQFADAVPILERSLREGKGQTDAFDLFFLAMCHHRLGDAAKAKSCYERANRWFQEHQAKIRMPGWVEELKAFQAEADAVLAQPPEQARK